jgi:hypothetical protein
MTLKVNEIKFRARQPKPPHGTAQYLKWWRARKALGKETKTGISQAQMIKDNKHDRS